MGADQSMLNKDEIHLVLLFNLVRVAARAIVAAVHVKRPRSNVGSWDGAPSRGRPVGVVANGWCIAVSTKCHLK